MTDNIYTYPKKEDLEIIVGDEKQENFYPRMKIKRWDNEVNFSVGVISAHVGTDSNISDKVEWDDGHGTKARFYETIDDKFEFEIELASKPSSNMTTLSIEMKGLLFYYQPELTEEEIGMECYRPENVIGSYAVYHESKEGDYSKMGGKNYRAGKAFHIYRPKIFDSSGKEVWGKLNIDVEKKLLNVEIPQDFLDNAVYPIRHAAGLTFGYETIGETTSWFTSSRVFGSWYTGAEGTANSITMYFKQYEANTPKIGLAIYKKSDKSLQGYTVSWILTSGWDDWKTLAITSGGALVGVDYWLMSGRESSVVVAWDTITNKSVRTASIYWTDPNWPNPLGSLTAEDRNYSIYCTYTPATPTGIARSKIDGGLAGRGLINGGLIR